MPFVRHRKFKRRAKKTYKKRQYRRKTTVKNAGNGRGFLGNTPKSLVIHNGLGFPARFRTKLRYTDTVSMSVVAGALKEYAYNCNGLFDPNRSGVGHQPMFFDQYMTIYNKYKVIGSKINVKIFQGTAAIPEIQCILIVNDDNTVAPAVDINQLIEWGLLNSTKMLGGYYGPTIPQQMNSRWSLRRYFKDKYFDDSLIGSASANPTDESCYIIAFQALDRSSNVNLSFQVTVDYIVDFFELKDVAQS